MKNLNISFVVILLFSNQFLFGQQTIDGNDEQAFLKQIESTTVSQALGSGFNLTNNSLIQQIGHSNIASINQTIIGTTSPGNIAELIQNGDVNNAVLIQTGNGNNHFINQTGNGNMFEASVIGNYNSSTVDQFGNDNMINQNLIGNDMAFILSQLGNSNQIIQVENDQNPRQYQIYQQGNGMKLIITNGGIVP